MKTYCARILDPEEVSAWQAERRRLALSDGEALREVFEACPLVVPPGRPWLLFDASDCAAIRDRADDEALQVLADRCDALVRTCPDAVNPRVAMLYQTKPAVQVAGGWLVLGKEEYAEWVRRRLRAVLGVPNWMNLPAHAFSKRCDHVMCNVAADIAYALDLLGEAADAALVDDAAGAVRERQFLPYLECARRRDEFWAQDRYLANQKIMSHGEAGLAICAFADRWPEAREGLRLAAEGVVEILDALPPDGDWPEGPGYWYGTLFMGLRLAWALRRLSGGAVDLFTHPRLDVTGDFGAWLVSPAGHVYNYGDNPDTLNTLGLSEFKNANANGAEALLMLAAEKQRPAWLTAARHFSSYSPFWLHLDDPGQPTAAQPSGARTFAVSGVGIMRQGDTYVGLHSGDNTVGHAHLDANSFVVEANGELLFRDSGTWPYAHLLGFFDKAEKRWHFDNMATVGHNAILVDGQGQTYGKVHHGTVSAPQTGEGWLRLDGDASRCYPGLLDGWTRSLVLVGEEMLVVRDWVTCQGERHVEWLLHAGGVCRDDGDETVVEGNATSARVTPLLPDRTAGWRVSDVARRSVYENSNTAETERPSIQYRSYSPFCAAPSFEFLFLLRLGSSEPTGYRFEGEAGAWLLDLPSAGVTLTGVGENLSCRPAPA